MRVVGDVQSFTEETGRLHVGGWVVDGFSATRPDQVEIDDIAGKPLAQVRSGEFVRRNDVADRFGSSAFSLSGFELSLEDPPTTLVVRAHLGQLGWWRTTVETPVARHALLTRLECVSSDTVEIEVSSAEPFPVRNAITELQIGPVVIRLTRYAGDGDLHSLIFTLTRDEFDSLSSGDQAFVRYEPSNLHDVWIVGSIDPSTADGCTSSFMSGGLPRVSSRAS